MAPLFCDQAKGCKAAFNNKISKHAQSKFVEAVYILAKFALA